MENNPWQGLTVVESDRQLFEEAIIEKKIVAEGRNTVVSSYRSNMSVEALNH